MLTTLFSSVMGVFHAVGGAVFAVAVSIVSLFGYVSSPSETVFTPEMLTLVATSSAPTPATSTPTLVHIPVPAATTPKPTPVVVIPSTPPVPPPVVVVPPPVVSVPNGSIGTTTMVVESIPLLGGGVAHVSKGPIPIIYLQITNVGKEGALLKGFWVKQNGSAPGKAIITLSTIDDRGGSRSLTGGVEGTTPFQNGSAFAPTDAYFAPGQLRLFTIFATVSAATTPYVGLDLKLDVSSVVSAGAVAGNFPIRGTTWTIAP